MKNTPFTEKHIALGAKMAEFAGYNMPISYTGINDEHAAVRNNAGVFDVSHMGEFILKGPKALDLIQRVTSNDASKLTAGKAQYSCLPNEQGGIVDDLIVYCLEENSSYMLVVNASNIEKDWNWISGKNTEGVEMHNVSDKTALLAIQGPKGMKPIGLGARDTLRLEKGFCLYGNDIDDTTSPLEAGLGWITKFTKDFTARPILEQQKAEGVQRKLVGLEMVDKGIPRHGYKIQDAEGNEIGYVTSGTQSPTLGKAIAIAYVAKGFAAEGTEVFVVVRDKALKAQVVKMPFLK